MSTYAGAQEGGSSEIGGLHWLDGEPDDRSLAHEDDEQQDALSPTVVGFFALLPLSVEFVRRFIFYSDLLFVASELAAVGFAALILLRAGSALARDALVLGFVVVITLLGVLSAVFGHGNPMLVLVGLRALLVPLAFAVIGEYVFRTFRDPLGFFARYTTVAVTVITVIAVVQVVAGASHWLNRLPVETPGEGIGDYVAANGVVIEALFRPTSMFLHTGKFGQALFTLVLFHVAILLTKRDRTPIAIGVLLLVDLVGIAVSGQRAALVFLLIAFVFWACFARARAHMGVLGSAVGVAALLALAAAPFAEWAIVEQVIDRFVTAFQGAGSRLESNFIRPLSRVLDFAGITGDGWGIFSLGASRFGGSAFVLSRYPVAAENAWLRLIAEMGPAGSLMYFAFFATLFVRAVRYSLQDDVGPAALYFLAAASWVVAVIGWSNTHDVVGNTTTTSLGFMFLGALWSYVRAQA